MDSPTKSRLKSFISMDSLWYEEERLATFIDWPVKFISSRELASDGFYYLRTEDHCACAFCRGIIGSWEKGDTPRGEHKRHFPHCPFVQGKVTPNVPLKLSHILSRVSKDVSSKSPSKKTDGEDVCGTGRKQSVDPCPDEGRVLKSLNSEVPMTNLGFLQYCGPKRKDYLTYDVRLLSFKNWPERVSQTPKELAEAGFYYCGLSDHVRCFHCGHGLRNWERTDNPWEEHARWFPECHFVLLTKGIEFIDKVRRERPPYVPKRASNQSSSGASSHNATGLTDEELDELMDLEIIRHVLQMGFSRNVVRMALKKKVLETGQPFFSVEASIDAVLIAMETETKDTIQGCMDVTSQAKKMAAYEASLRNQASAGSSSHATSSEPLQHLPTPTSSMVESNDTLPTLPNRNEAISLPVSPSTLPSLPISACLPPPLRSSTPTSQVLDRIEGDVLPDRVLPIGTDDPSQRILERTEDVPPQRITTVTEDLPPARSGEDVPPQRIPARSGDDVPPQRIPASSGDDMPPQRIPARSGEDVPSQRIPARSGEDVPPQRIPARSGENVPLQRIPARSGEDVPPQRIPARSGEDVPPQRIPARSGDDVPPQRIPARSGDDMPPQRILARSGDDMPPQRILANVEADMPSADRLEEQGSAQAAISSEGNSRDCDSAVPSLIPNQVRVDLPREVAPLISEADCIMEEAAKLLNTSSSSADSQVSSSMPSQTASSPPSVSSISTHSSLPLGGKLDNEEEGTAMTNPESIARELEKMREEQMCRVCMDKKMDVVFLPCTHMATCSTCAVALSSCPICRRDIQYAFKPIIP